MFLKNVLTYSGANAVGQLARLIQEFVVRVLLPPKVMGVWSFVIVVRNFGATFDLNVLAASSRKIALLYGAEDEARIYRYRSTAFFLHLAQKSLIALGVVVYAFVSYDSHSTLETVGVLAAAAMVLLSALGEAFISFFQSAQRYTTLSKVLVVYWSVFSVLMVAGVYVAEVPGLIAAAVMALVFQAVLLRASMRTERLAMGWHWDWKSVKSLLGFAVPFKVVDYPMSLFSMLDVLFVTRYLGLEALAIYSTAKLMLMQAYQVPGWMTSVTITRITTLIGAQRSREELGKEMFRNLLVHYLIIIPTTICFMIVAARFIFPRFIPEYVDSIGLLATLLFSLYFVPNVTVIRNFWIIDKRFAALGVSNLVGLAAMGMGFWIGTSLWEMDLLIVARIFLISFIIYFCWLLFTLGNELWGLRKSIVLILYIIGSVSITLFALQMAGALGREVAVMSFGNAVYQIFICLVIILPIVAFGIWRVGLFDYLRKRFLM